MCEIDTLVFGMYGLFGALGSIIIYKTMKAKKQKVDPYMLDVIGDMKKEGTWTNGSESQSKKD
tara:strand:+ start:1816 stop:2004 length:189 start_codon:yes stop_codon:yes gene_type:complete